LFTRLPAAKITQISEFTPGIFGELSGLDGARRGKAFGMKAVGWA
jgi:hypothetical protein